MKLNKEKRLILWLLSDLQEKLVESGIEDDNDIDYSNYKYILENGYTREYYQLTNRFFEELNAVDCEEVIQIAEMYRNLIVSNDQLSDENRLKIVFSGFDANHASKQLGYIKYLLNRKGSYQILKRDQGKNFDLNNHGLVALDQYRKMLARWQEIKHRSDITSLEHKWLSKEDIKYILGY